MVTGGALGLVCHRYEEDLREKILKKSLYVCELCKGCMKAWRRKVKTSWRYTRTAHRRQEGYTVKDGEFKVINWHLWEGADEGL